MTERNAKLVCPIVAATPTLGYAKEMKNRQGRYGDPFAALPAALIDPSAPERTTRAEHAHASERATRADDEDDKVQVSK